MRARQDEALRAREELIDNMELLAQETGRQTERTARQRDERRREIDHQVFIILRFINYGSLIRFNVAWV